jgi:hypothetical protein
MNMNMIANADADADADAQKGHLMLATLCDVAN